MAYIYQLHSQNNCSYVKMQFFCILIYIYIADISQFITLLLLLNALNFENLKLFLYFIKLPVSQSNVSCRLNIGNFT